jgi:hypothetical protein
MIKQSKLVSKTKNKLKQIIKDAPNTTLSEDAEFALKINGEITGKEAIKSYNQWKRS